MSARLESGLLLTARILELMLTLCLLGGREAGGAAGGAGVAADVWLQFATCTDLFGHQRPSDERLAGPFDGLRAGIFIAKLMFPVVLGAFLWQAWQRPAKKLLLVALTALMVGEVFVSGERMALLLSLAGLALAVLLQRGAARRLLGAVMVCAVMSVVVLALADPRMLQRHVAQTAATAESLRDSPYG